jgi:hypothetical protein
MLFKTYEKEIQMKFKLDIKRDVDEDGDAYFLWLPHGFRFSDDLVHVRGFDTIAEIRKASKTDVVPCDCQDCKKGLEVLSQR